MLKRTKLMLKMVQDMEGNDETEVTSLQNVTYSSIVSEMPYEAPNTLSDSQFEKLEDFPIYTEDGIQLSDETRLEQLNSNIIIQEDLLIRSQIVDVPSTSRKTIDAIKKNEFVLLDQSFCLQPNADNDSLKITFISGSKDLESASHNPIKTKSNYSDSDSTKEDAPECSGSKNTILETDLDSNNGKNIYILLVCNERYFTNVSLSENIVEEVGLCKVNDPINGEGEKRQEEGNNVESKNYFNAILVQMSHFNIFSCRKNQFRIYEKRLRKETKNF